MLKRILALLALCWASSAGAFVIPSPYSIVEYVNEGTGRYTLVRGGSRHLEDGGEGGRWTRTGYVFTQYTFDQLGESPVCHLYSPLHDTHFFTPYAAECAALKQPGSGWVFVGNEFNAPLPGPNGCFGSSVAMRRLYNGGADHRYSADPAIIEKMRQRGWIDEGIGFCAYEPRLAPERSFGTDFRGPPRPKAECEAKVGSCIAVTQLAPMTTLVQAFLPPAYVVQNPSYPGFQAVQALVGTGGHDLYTSQPAGSTAVLQHSFYVEHGVHVKGSDRLAGPYAGMSPMVQLPGVAGPTIDERVFPWRGGRERELVIKSDISVTTLTRANSSSHAYGMPLLQFTDRASGRSVLVGLQAFGLAPVGDYIGPDFFTGWAIVSTSFRADPLFGRRISGNYTQCSGSLGPCLPRTIFAFELSKADFQKVLGHARTVDATLSTDPADYFVASFRHHNETYLDATMGMFIFSLDLAIWPRVQ